MPEPTHGSPTSSSDHRNPFANPSVQQLPDPNQRYYDESDVGDPYARRETYASENSHGGSNDGPHYFDQQGGYDSYSK